MKFGSALRLRTALDVGGAVAIGIPSGEATGSTEAGFHSALHARPVGIFRISDAVQLEPSASVGYASSLRARANDADVASLDGLLFTVELAARLGR